MIQRTRRIGLLLQNGFVLKSLLLITIVAPAVDIITEELNVTTTFLRPMALSVFLLGYAMDLWSLVLCLRFGAELWCCRYSTFLFQVFNSACGVARTTEQLLAFRFFAGLFGSCTVEVR